MRQRVNPPIQGDQGEYMSKISSLRYKIYFMLFYSEEKVSYFGNRYGCFELLIIFVLWK